MILTLILVDDDLDDADFFRSVLSEVAPNVKFVHIEDGSDLVRLSEALLPNIVFLDVNMPRIDGWECLQRLRESVIGREIPIFMFSTSTHFTDQQRSRDLGASGFITKPSSVLEFRKILLEITRKFT